MAQYYRGPLAPVPASIMAAARRQRDRLRGRRVIVAPHGDLAGNLLARGLFAGFDLLGTADRSTAKIGRSIFGLAVHGYDALPTLRPDAIVIASTRYHAEIAKALAPVAELIGADLVDLCADYDQAVHRHEITAFLNVERLLLDGPYEGDFPIDVAVTVPDEWGLGDKLCAMSAARELARRHPQWRVHAPDLPEIVAAYRDGLLATGPAAVPLPENSRLFHREKDHSPAGNYLGCSYLGLGLDFTEPPALDLPPVLPLDGLAPGSYAVLQPRANWARPNLDQKQLQAVADGLDLPVVQVGKPDPDLALTGLSDLGMGDPLTMLRAIRHAALVLAPRSASSHIAAGYRVPSVIWVPDDGENWHLDYPFWPHRRVRVASETVVADLLAAVRALRAKAA